MGDADAGRRRLSRGAVAWSLFQGGRDPYIILVVIYVFAPYVASRLVGDPVRGQEAISRLSQYTGWIVMLTAPLLGAAVDRMGRRKRVMGAVLAVMIPAIAGLWFAAPGPGGLPLWGVLSLMGVAGTMFAFSEVLHNSMLIGAAGFRDAHRASGLALALGAICSVAALIFTTWAFVLPGKLPAPGIPHAPLFGLDPAQAEPQRVVALLCAGALLLGSVPMFLFTADTPSSGMKPLAALKAGARDLWTMLSTVGHYKDAVTFLVSRMLFVDGMNAILVYAGIYATGVMKWGPLEMLAYGILLSGMSAFGGFLCRWLDHALGPRNALRLEITVTILAIVASLGMSPTRILYFWAYDPAAHAPLWHGPVFRTLPEVIYILIGFFNATFITAQYSSSRTLLTRLTPPERTGAFFGVYALAGVATGWLAPTLVNIGTHVTHSQQGGFVGIVALLVGGLIGLAFVRGGGPMSSSG